MKHLEVLKERNIYDISIVDDNRYLAGTIVDLDRDQYYLVLPDKYDKGACDFIITNIIDVISVKGYEGKKVGEIKTYSKELLDKTLENLGYEETESSSYKGLINNNIESIDNYNYLR